MAVQARSLGDDHAAREDHSAAGILAWARELTESPLRDAVDLLAEPTRTIAGYHLGWWNEHGDPDQTSPGKALRPALTLLCAEAVGASASRATVAAAAVELVHNFSLLHDDVMDGDRMRRHRPTAWVVFGGPAAILAGDALLSLAFAVLAQCYPRGLQTMTATLVELCNGQTADLAFEHQTEVSLEECVVMAGNKTASLLGCACELGAMAGDADTTCVRAIRLFGYHLGLAFQLTDDLLGIWGDPATTGKPAGSDLRSGKKTLPIVVALANDMPAAQRLAALCARSESLDDVELATVASLIDQAGGRVWAQREAVRHRELALDYLNQARPTPHVTARLTALATLATRRDH